jgi:hypothetical protein
MFVGQRVHIAFGIEFLQNKDSQIQDLVQNMSRKSNLKGGEIQKLSALHNSVLKNVTSFKNK